MTGRSGVEDLEDLMRRRCVDLEARRVLLARIAGTAQARDLATAPNAGGFGRIRHFRSTTAPGWPPNPLPGLPSSSALGRRFDETTRAQVFQIAGCAMRCWYCYVPYPMLSGDERRGAWLTADELLDLYLASADRPKLIVLSGGSPDIAPEWVAWTMDGLEARELAAATYLWTDDNLSSDRLVLPENRALLRRIERYGNHARVCCLKGYDGPSFAFTTQGRPEDFERQLGILERYLATEMDLYGYITFGAPDDDPRDPIRRLMDRISGTSARFLSRIVPLRLEVFGPTATRLDGARRKALERQDATVRIWLEELERRNVLPIWSPQ